MVVVLWQHGGWGADSAHIAAQVIEAYVDKQRRLAHNLQEAKAPAAAKTSASVDVGAVWSAPQPVDAKNGIKPGAETAAPMQGGHFTLKIPRRFLPQPAAGIR